MKIFLEIMGLIFTGIIGAGLVVGIVWFIFNLANYIERHRTLKEEVHYLFDKLVELENLIKKGE